MIHVIAVITARPGKREAILQAFRANVPAVRAEKGCAYRAKTKDMIASRRGAGGMPSAAARQTVPRWERCRHRRGRSP